MTTITIAIKNHQGVVLGSGEGEINPQASPRAKTASVAPGATYTLVFRNRSGQGGTGTVYQTDRNLGGGMVSLAWFSKYAAAGGQAGFEWDTTYRFAWSQTGVLKPGQAQPAAMVRYTPRPQYWIAFGDLREGEVLDIQTINHPAPVEFPAGVFAMEATLHADGGWTVEALPGAREQSAGALPRSKVVILGIASSPCRSCLTALE